MLTFISFALVATAVVVAVPAAVLVIEVVAAIVLPDRDYSTGADEVRRPRVAVLIPAHNESIGLRPTLMDIKEQIQEGDRLLVVADNCSDETADVAAVTGAEVIQRHDPIRRGKGYALSFGLRHLSMDPPEVVIMVDADCRLPAGAVERLAMTCALTERPIQSLSSMVMDKDSPIDARVSEFAWRLKNFVRPRGLCNLGLPCQLMGAGMAFPWGLICNVDLASGSIVEDLKLGLDLAVAGKPPLFCPFPGVVSYFPFTPEGLESQRLRWERGHISMILKRAPSLLAKGLVTADSNLLALAFDLAVPPLTLLGLLVLGVFTASGLASWFGISSAAMLISSASLVGLIGAVFVSWLNYGRKILPPGSILLIFSYVLGKIPIYGMILRKSKSQWIRADRTKI